ncbi:MAG: hypothetical protein JXB05_32690, partial [Myxococcaceae bacterium]|nr:hypothetical protein [Myxococcaceae bacterium]
MKKLLTLRDLDVEDSMALFFRSTIDHEADIQRELEPFLQALEEHAGEWMPNIVEGKRQRKYSRDTLWKSLEEGSTGYSWGTGLFHTTYPFASLALRFGVKNIPRQLRAGLHIQPLTYFAEAERCRALIDLVRAWVCRYPVSYTSAHSTADNQLADTPYFGRDEETAFQDGYDKVYQVCWLNVFGPRLVETVGRERMLSTPAHLVEELPNGSVLLVTWPTAADFASEEARKAQA